MSSATKFEVSNRAAEFTRIFEEHYELSYRTAFSITRSVEDAEDVVQSIFLQLLRRENLPDLARNPKGYFYRSAVNLSLRTIRHRKRQVLTSESERFEAAIPVETNEEEIDTLLWKAIGELGESSAQIVILRYVHDYSLKQIASTLQTTRGAVAISLFRSRSRLKKIIAASQSGAKS